MSHHKITHTYIATREPGVSLNELILQDQGTSVTRGSLSLGANTSNTRSPLNFKRVQETTRRPCVQQ